ncbi:ecotropic viral integration site 5 protein homolog [Pyxicephalus adspersus]|uniref:ecotropic viral integration site 5 protein homolog n=1 Tax=Pyxicephalus adspersus TaxID=30357 RepID=UPI003B59DCD8
MASQVASPSASLHTTSSSTTLSTPALSPSSPVHLSPDEVELLAKLEEQNRLLEIDSKSLRSVNGSRRNSGSSLVSSSSASSNLSHHQEEDSWLLWGRIVNEWEEVYKKKEKQIKELVRKGIPHHFRAIVWQLLCNAQNMPIKEQYSELLKMTSPCEKLIRRDIARTYPEHDFFKEKDSLGQEVLFNVMKAYSLVDREVGYCQGSAFIVGLLLMQMPEEEAFCVFVKLMQDYRLRELFKPSMAELGLCMYQFECMIQVSMVADHYLYGVSKLLQKRHAMSPFARKLICLLHFHKVIPHQFDGGPEKLIQVAYQVKYNAKKMKKYVMLKLRLRTENRLLKQRIETLEKESASLADRLIQGQVTRAQEAEENYLIKRELATMKQQNDESSSKLDQAHHTIVELLQQQQLHKCNPRYSEEFVLQLEKELVQARLKEAESHCAMKEMQDKILEIEKKNNSFPDENNVARLQEELIAVKLREAEAVMALKEQKQQIRDLEDHWQRHLARTAGRWKDPPKKNTINELQDELMSVRLREAERQAELREMKQRMMELDTQNQINSNHLRRAEQETNSLQAKVQYLSAQNKTLQTQLTEAKRKQAEIECKCKKDLILKEEGKIQGQLNNSDSSQYIRELKDQIAELKHEIRCLKSQKGLSDPPTFDGIHIVNHIIGDDVSFHSSDEDFATGSIRHGDVHYGLANKHAKMMLVPSDLDSSDSDTEELDVLANSDVVVQKAATKRTESYSTTV